MTVQYPNEVTSGLVHKYERNTTRNTRGLAPMTLSQASYLMTLCEETGEAFDDSLTQADATRLIRRLEDATARGPGREGRSTELKGGEP
jgi:Protein of unknown function (DUF3072)